MSFRKICLNLTLSLIVLATAGQANADTGLKAFDIPAQPLATALRQFAEQTGLQLAFETALTAGRTSPEIKGQLSSEQALAKLLQGTGLRYDYLDNRTIAVSSATKTTQNPSPGTGEGGTTQWGVRDPAHAVAADGSPVGPTKGLFGKLRLSQTDKDQKAQKDSVSSDTESEVISEAGIPEILVRGSKILNMDIKRTEDSPQPYIVFDRQQIERSMVTNLEDFLRTRLTMNNSSRSTISQASTSALAPRVEFDLRGLGSNQTLILVDGRRMPSINGGTGAFLQPDLNGIPLAAVERIEVLPSTASGIYGGGATGGVINIILRRDYAGLETVFRYDNTFDTDVGSRRFDVSGGLSLEGGRTHLLLSASHTDSKDLLLRDRMDLVERSWALQFANNPSAFLPAGLPTTGSTSNIRSQSGNLQLKPAFGGTALNSPVTFVPIGYPGITSDNGAGLVANAGRHNLMTLADEDIATSLLPAYLIPEQDSALLNLRRSFSTRVEAIFDFSWLRTQTSTFLSPSPINVILPVTAPNNPFTTAINVRFPVIGDAAKRGGEAGSQTLRAVAGLIARLPRDWTASVDYGWSRARSGFASDVNMGDSDGAGPRIPYTTALMNGTLDVLRDLQAFPLDYAPYLVSTRIVGGPMDTLLKSATLRFSGPLAQLPGGVLTLSSLIEQRDEEFKGLFQVFADSPPVQGVVRTSYNPGRSQAVDSYSLEARVPLIGSLNALSWARELEFVVSGRRDEYETAQPTLANNTIVPSRDGPIPATGYVTNQVGATKYTLALRYSPVQDLAVRASVGTGFLAPSINQLLPNFGTFSVAIIDPKRDGTSQNITIDEISGGNPNLRPENSKSWSAGIILTPRFIKNLRLSIDYLNLEKTDEIRSLGNQTMVDLEDRLGRITRAALTDADRALGYTRGIITDIDRSLVNVSYTKLEAYDVQADYTWPTQRFGDFHLYAVATWQPHLKSQVVPGAAIVDTVGFSSGQLERRMNAGLTWEKGPWAFDWNTQWYDSYLVYTATASAATRATNVLNQGSDTIPSQVYHDLSMRYRFEGRPTFLGGILANTEIQAGILNVFNTAPPVLATIFASSALQLAYSSYGDPRLRRYSIGIKKTFGAK